MVPVELKLRNFLSYGVDVPPLDFTEFHVACLSGPNGNGKSALLDAITWALFGEARKSSSARKPDDELLRAGAKDMAVEFTFDLDGQRFRVVRSFSKAKKTAVSGLELQVFDPDEGVYHAETTGSTGATQKRIEQHLAMDYTTFINSSFLLQGRADEFTKKSAQDRKKVLATILNLERYDRLAELARERGRNAKSEAQTLEYQRIGLLDGMAAAPALRDELAALDLRLEDLQGDLEAQTGRLQGLLHRRQALELKRREADGWRTERTRIDGERTAAQAERDAARQTLSGYEQILARQAEIERDAARHESLAAEIDRLNVGLGTLNALERRRAELSAQRARAESELRRRQTALGAQVESAAKEIERTERTLARRAEVEQKLTAYRAAQTEDAALESGRARRDELKARIQRLAYEIDEQRATRKAELTAMTERLDALRAVFRRGDEARAQQQTLADQAEQRTEVQQQIEALTGRGETLTAEIAAAEALVAGIERELAALDEQATAFHESGDQCPVCTAALTPERRSEVDRHRAVERRRLATELERGRGEVAWLTEARARLRTEFKTLKADLDRFAGLDAQIGAADAVLAEAARAKDEGVALKGKADALRSALEQDAIDPAKQTEWSRLTADSAALGYDESAHGVLRATLRDLARFDGADAILATAEQERTAALAARTAAQSALTDVTDQLDTDAFAPTERDALADLAAQIAGLGYDESAHAWVRAELTALSTAPVAARQLATALAAVGPVRAQIAGLEATAARLDEAQRALDGKLASVEAELAALPELRAGIATVEAALADVQADLSELQHRRGATGARLEACDRMATQLVEVEARLVAVRDDEKLHAELVRAFGKNGIQALIIENALPEIELEANLLLNRLTDGRTSVHLETMREQRNGGVAETLDIHISDELGVARSYETYSGGEAFRVNFALRIALSKLLARRAGAQLRTLVIDEGFGTQDADGLEHMVDAIQHVAGDFDKVLLVTHLEELKNQFPTRIEVKKHPELGSRFEIVG